MAGRGRKRTQGKHLPTRMYEKSGSYYFVDKDNKWINLGKDFGRAIERYNSFNEGNDEIITINDLIDRYLKEVAPTKAPKTYKCNLFEAKYLRAAFGKMHPEDLTAKAIYLYMDARSAKVSANRELSLLSPYVQKGDPLGCC